MRDETEPLALEAHRPGRSLFSRTGIPVACITVVAFDAMEVGMDPRAIRAVDVVAEIMCGIPLVFLYQP